MNIFDIDIIFMTIKLYYQNAGNLKSGLLQQSLALTLIEHTLTC